MKRIRKITVFAITGLLLAFIFTACDAEPKTVGELLEIMEKSPSEEKAELLIRRINKNDSFPIVEDSGVFFIYSGKSDSAVSLTGDMNSWDNEGIRMSRIEGTDIYFTKQSYIENARLEYKFIIDGKYITDPLNKVTDIGGYGENSVLMMPLYVFPKSILYRQLAVSGKLDTVNFKSDILNNTRNIYVYSHPKCVKSSPLIVFHDGSDYLKFGYTKTILDNLIDEGKIPPLNALFVDPANRQKEYWINDNYLKMIFRELLPYVLKKYDLNPSQTGMVGASLGGLISFYALKDYGHKLNFVYSQSGAFWVEDEAILKEISEFSEINTKIYFDYGSFERVDESHKNIFDALNKHGIRYSSRVYNEGHNWGNWRAHLGLILQDILKEESKN
ncbi:MAG: alpha/beta hydrolase-fold protein [Calditrichaceae bacterium]